MSPALRPLAWTFVAVALSALTAFVVARWSGGHQPHRHAPAPASGAEGGTFHDWLHEQLAISPEEEQRLEPIEADYAAKRAERLARIDAASARLAQALGGSKVDRAAIDAALAEIHTSQGELQSLTIAHFLEMKEHLTPDQAEKLLQWTRESIAHEPHR